MRVKCYSCGGNYLGCLDHNKAACLVRKHLAAIVEADRVLRDCLIAIKLKDGVPFDELAKKNWRFCK